MVEVLTPGREALTAERDDLLRRLHMTPGEARGHAEAGDFRGEEWALWDRLESVMFLLGEDA